jgi:energy-coupling factor transporter ATP-binding protein EcfA2
MALLKMKNVSFTYSSGEYTAIKDFTASISSGDMILLCGPSGSGKSTLLHLLKPEIRPAGQQAGEILYREKHIDSYAPSALTTEIALLEQNPENQLVMDSVIQELAFGLENLGYSSPMIQRRMAEMVHFFGLEPLLHKSIHALSGGQKQIVNLASLLLMQPRILLLDEPTSQLDPIAARELIQMIYKINQELGITVILTEHRLEEIFPYVDQVWLMDQGKMVYFGDAKEVIHTIWNKRDESYIPFIPSIPMLYLNRSEADALALPLTVKEGQRWLIERQPECRPSPKKAEQTASKVSLLELKHVRFQYDKKTDPILHHLSFTVNPGDFLAILGCNGAGKSTLLQIMGGLLRPQDGKVEWQGQSIHKQKQDPLSSRIGYLPQNPLLYFVHDTVEKELKETAKRCGLASAEEDINSLLSTFQLDHRRSSHPHDLSGGELQKAALACILLTKPKLLLLDEPTKGLDPGSKKRFSQLLEGLHQQGLTIVMVTHDVEFAASHAKRCALLFNGALTGAADPNEFFKGNFFYTTTMHRMVRGHFPDAITYEEVLEQWPSPAEMYSY